MSVGQLLVAWFIWNVGAPLLFFGGLFLLLWLMTRGKK